MGKKAGKGLAPAVAYTFAAGDSESCALIRRDVDDVLAKVSKHGIKSTTPNEHLLTVYLWPDRLERLYAWLNERLGKYPGFQPFAADSIDGTTTIGDVREMAYKNCNATCSSI